jgi:K+-transporting ATPase A subunit
MKPALCGAFFIQLTVLITIIVIPVIIVISVILALTTIAIVIPRRR